MRRKESKENLVWEDQHGRQFFFDYEINLENSHNHEPRTNFQSVVERLKTKAIYSAYRLQQAFRANGLVEED